MKRKILTKTKSKFNHFIIEIKNHKLKFRTTKYIFRTSYKPHI